MAKCGDGQEGDDGLLIWGNKESPDDGTDEYGQNIYNDRGESAHGGTFRGEEGGQKKVRNEGLRYGSPNTNEMGGSFGGGGGENEGH